MFKKIAFATIAASSMMIAAAQTTAPAPVAAKPTQTMKAVPAKHEHKTKAHSHKAKTNKHTAKKTNTTAPKLEAN